MNLKKFKKNDIFFILMNKKKQKIILFFLFSFSAYCAIIIGKSWDEGYHLLQGKSTLTYLFSLGRIDNYFWGREYYSAFYWSLQYLFTTIFPAKYQVESSHLLNLIFSFLAIIGIGQIGKELFNKKVGKIIFLVLFFYPIFFGHMSMNSSDTIIAFGHVWITLLVLKYLKNQHRKDKSSINTYPIIIGILAALSTGVQIFFLASLAAVILFILFEIFLFKKIINKNFDKKKFFYDILKSFIIFYLFLILFWIDVHSNILILPYKVFMAALSNTYMTGLSFILVNGNYYLSNEAPKLYFLINIIFKSPEYFLIAYLLFFITIFKSNIFFNKKFNCFNYKLYFIIFMLVFPNLVSIIIPLPLYDGLRLFLWTLPYFCIIPGLMIYYLIENFKFTISKFMLVFLLAPAIYFLIIFIKISPYHYTYLNIFNGELEKRYQNFENDYWGASIKELIKNANFGDEKVLKIATCGVNPGVVKKYLYEKGFSNNKFVSPKESDYLIMTNRSTHAGEKYEYSKQITNCFEKYKGRDVFKVFRNGLVLSVIRKIE
tara:strand:+ start:658 stop:2289 length:1632 start_codon:yes stop_codon:yes gene_type:complete